jgi:plasmid stabilization system protein ParE
MYKLIFSKLFEDDIESAYYYIKDNLEASMTAENLMKEVKRKLEYLKENPFARSFVQDEFLANMKIRSIKVKNYVIYYSVNDDANRIKLIRFLYNRRDWKNILSEN